MLHFLAETEVVFGLWAAVLFFGIALLSQSMQQAVQHIDSLNFTEPKFVFVVMVIAATRPVVTLAESLILMLARLIPLREGLSFYIAALSFGTLLGSFITEPAAMTLLAILLKHRYFDRGIRPKLAYATLGLLFVNISIGGTLTHFAAPPVLMVASKWNWDTAYLFTHFGWRAAAACLTSTLMVSWIFRKELSQVPVQNRREDRIPVWLTLTHLASLGSVVAFAHHPDVFFGVFMIFLGVVYATLPHQDGLKFREGLLVGFFLAGLVTLGSLQSWWLKPLITGMDGVTLYFGATALTEIRSGRRCGDGRRIDGDRQRAQSRRSRHPPEFQGIQGNRHQPVGSPARSPAADRSGDRVLLVRRATLNSSSAEGRAELALRLAGGRLGDPSLPRRLFGRHPGYFP